MHIGCATAQKGFGCSCCTSACQFTIVGRLRRPTVDSGQLLPAVESDCSFRTGKSKCQLSFRNLLLHHEAGGLQTTLNGLASEDAERIVEDQLEGTRALDFQIADYRSII